MNTTHKTGQEMLNINRFVIMTEMWNRLIFSSLFYSFEENDRISVADILMVN